MVVERWGCVFSDVVDELREVDTVLGETMGALGAAGIAGPFVLYGHSMAVLEAIRWAQRYPREVSAIVSLDAAVPSTYEHVAVPNSAALRLLSFGARLGITRFFPTIVDDSAAIRAGSLTDQEKTIHRAVF